MILDLTKNSAYSDKTPYEVWQETEGDPIVPRMFQEACDKATVKNLMEKYYKRSA